MQSTRQILQIPGREAAGLSWGEHPAADREQDEKQYSQENLWNKGLSTLNTMLSY